MHRFSIFRLWYERFKQFGGRYPYVSLVFIVFGGWYVVLASRLTFLGDDWRYLYEMERQSHPIGYVLHPYLTAFAWRPLSDLSWVLHYMVFGAHPLSYHLVNVLLFFFTTWLVWVMIKKLFNERLAVTTALLFFIFPLHHETILWVSGRTDSLALIASLLAVWFFLHAQSQGAGRSMQWWYLASIMVFFLSLFFKEFSIVTPAIIFLMDILFISEGHIRELMRRRWWVYVLYAGATALFIGLRIAVLGNVVAQDARVVDSFTLLPSIADLSHIFLLFSHLFNSSTLKEEWPQLYNIWSPWHQYISAVFLLVLFGSNYRHLREWKFWRGILFALGMFFCYLWPVLFLLPNITTDLKHIRFLYAPSIGVVLLVAWFISYQEQATRKPTLFFRLSMTAIVFIAGFATVINAAPWQAASERTTQILNTFGVQYPEFVATSIPQTVYVHAIPGEIDGAYIFHDYYSFGQAVKEQYKNTNLSIQSVGTLPVADSPFCSGDLTNTSLVQWKKDQFVLRNDVVEQWSQKGTSSLNYAVATPTIELPPNARPSDFHSIELTIEHLPQGEQPIPLTMTWTVGKETSPLAFHTIRINDIRKTNHLDLCAYPNWVVSDHIRTIQFQFSTQFKNDTSIRNIRLLP
ncbi:MAG: glycosyltransferase family 39 protein [Candidatus Kerfeldbacteria bacterium]|nr:glycosyltransferase family 39 protein [Candidatus Kerfeldbacteria bacterium]